ncbi:MAG: hypothetical protein M1451_00320, partial [Acidobacteria bacterium]|nr:hypothetical protein [Acidobacteriota bacterium]
LTHESEKRAKLSQKVRVRPSEPRGSDFDEVVETINVCRNGIYFSSNRASYHVDMRLFVTYPYSTEQNALNQEYLGRVVRIDNLAGGLRGIAVQLQMKLILGARETIGTGH